MVGPNFRVGKKIGCGNFGELRLGEVSVMPVNQGGHCWGYWVTSVCFQNWLCCQLHF